VWNSTEDPSGESPEGCPRSVPRGAARISTCVKSDCPPLTLCNRESCRTGDENKEA